MTRPSTPIGCADRRADLLGHRRSGGEIRRFGQHHGELVPTEASDDGAVADGHADPVGHLAEDGVAAVAPDHRVQRLELVDVA